MCKTPQHFASSGHHCQVIIASVALAEHRWHTGFAFSRFGELNGNGYCNRRGNGSRAPGQSKFLPTRVGYSTILRFLGHLSLPLHATRSGDLFALSLAALVWPIDGGDCQLRQVGRDTVLLAQWLSDYFLAAA